MLPLDYVDFNRKLKNISTHKINQVDLKAFKNEISLILNVMKKDFSLNWRKITNDEVNEHGEKYKEIYKHNYFEEIVKSNPYEFLVPEIQQYSKFYFKTVIDDIENNTREQKSNMEQSLNEIVDNLDSENNDQSKSRAGMEVENDSDSDEEEFERDAYMKLNNTDKQLLRMFALEVNFDGILQEKTILQCQEGNIFCTECKKRIIQKDQSIQILEKYGAMIMQHHLVGDNQYIGFATYKNKNQMKETKEFDKSLIVRCPATSNKSLCTQLHKALELDALKTKTQRTKGWTHAIVLVQCVLSNFYGNKKWYYREYIKRGARRLGRALEYIKIDISKKHTRTKKTIPKDLKKLMQQFHDIYFDRKSYGPNFAERSNDTLLAITTNPKPKNKKRVMYHGHDVTDYAPGPERKKQKYYLDEKEYKINWHTVELVNKRRRAANHELSELSKSCEKQVHWLGTSTVWGKETHFLVNYDLIPEKFRQNPGEVFTEEFFTNVRYNVPIEVDQSIKNRFKEHYDILENTVLSRIRLKIDNKTKEKKWEAVTLDGHTVQHVVDEKWLRTNFEKQYPHYFIKYMTEKNIWHQLPVGAKRDIQNLSKTEDDEFVPIYSPNEFKCAFSNLANGLNAIHDYETAEFFEKHMNSDHETLTNLLNDDGSKSAKSQFQIAIRLLQYYFGYTCIKLKKTDTLLKPPHTGTIKYVTLVAGHDDHNHVISIVQKKVFDSSNKKVLTLCKENIAWCCTKTIESLDKTGQTIQSGYLLKPPKRIKKLLCKRNIHEMQPDTDKQIHVRKYKKQKVSEESV